jgi:hypothetical protein
MEAGVAEAAEAAVRAAVVRTAAATRKDSAAVKSVHERIRLQFLGSLEGQYKADTVPAQAASSS